MEPRQLLIIAVIIIIVAAFALGWCLAALQAAEVTSSRLYRELQDEKGKAAHDEYERKRLERWHEDMEAEHERVNLSLRERIHALEVKNFPGMFAASVDAPEAGHD